MLASFVNINSFVSDIYMDDIFDMPCNINHIHLEMFFIQQKHDLIL